MITIIPVAGEDCRKAGCENPVWVVIEWGY